VPGDELSGKSCPAGNEDKPRSLPGKTWRAIIYSGLGFQLVESADNSCSSQAQSLPPAEKLMVLCGLPHRRLHASAPPGEILIPSCRPAGFRHVDPVRSKHAQAAPLCPDVKPMQFSVTVLPGNVKGHGVLPADLAGDLRECRREVLLSPYKDNAPAVSLAISSSL
jgi:hypothetical protein